MHSEMTLAQCHRWLARTRTMHRTTIWSRWWFTFTRSCPSSYFVNISLTCSSSFRHSEGRCPNGFMPLTDYLSHRQNVVRSNWCCTWTSVFSVNHVTCKILLTSAGCCPYTSEPWCGHCVLDRTAMHNPR
jgi:hypothetical protein